jgi:hypothetical protein
MNQKSDKKIRADLERIHEWASGKIGAGNEPPWAWYQYMKLRETIDAILGGMAVVTTTASSPQSEQPQGAGLRLAASNDSREIARRRQLGKPVRLPM